MGSRIHDSVNDVSGIASGEDIVVDKKFLVGKSHKVMSKHCSNCSNTQQMFKRVRERESQDENERAH